MVRVRMRRREFGRTVLRVKLGGGVVVVAVGDFEVRELGDGSGEGGEETSDVHSVPSAFAFDRVDEGFDSGGFTRSWLGV